jgi:hypothetical protein
MYGDHDNAAVSVAGVKPAIGLQPCEPDIDEDLVEYFLPFMTALAKTIDCFPESIDEVGPRSFAEALQLGEIDLVVE